MTSSTLQLFTQMRESSSTQWKVSPEEIEKAVEGAVKERDFETLVAFLSTSPRKSGDSAYSLSPYDLWSSLCAEQVLPALSENARLDTVKIVCQALHKCNRSYFVQAAFNFLDKNKSLALEPLSTLVADATDHTGLALDQYTWRDAISFLQNNNYTLAIPAIAEGYNNIIKYRNINQEHVAKTTVNALLAYNNDAADEAIYSLLSVPNESNRFSVISALEQANNKRSIKPLQRRLGGFLRKPAESSARVRKRIKQVIKNLKNNGN